MNWRRWVPPEFKRRTWWYAWAIYMVFSVGLYYPAHWLLWHHSHTAFYISWGVIIYVGMVMLGRTDRALRRRADQRRITDDIQR